MQRLEEIRNGVAWAVVCIIFYFFFEKNFLLWGSCLFLLTALLDNKAATAFQKGCLKLTHLLGRFYLNLFLTLLYFLVLTPVALLYRLFNREKTAHFKKKKKGSCFIDRETVYRKTDFEKTW